MKYSKTEEIIYGILDARNVYHKRKGLELFGDTIYYNNYPAGYVCYNGEYSDITILALTAQTMILPRRVANNLAQEANDHGIGIVYLPMIDFGFGLPDIVHDLSTVKKMFRRLKSLPALVGKGNHLVSPTEWEPFAYSYVQMLDIGTELPKIYSAGQLLSEFMNICIAEERAVPSNTEAWVFACEPTVDEVQRVLNSSARSLKYLDFKVYKTEEHWDLLVQLSVAQRTNQNGEKIKYSEVNK